MKVETYIDQHKHNNNSPSLNALKELYSILSIESIYIEVGKDITYEYYSTRIAKNWESTKPFVVIDGKPIGNAYQVIRKFIKEGLISSQDQSSGKLGA